MHWHHITILSQFIDLASHHFDTQAFRALTRVADTAGLHYLEQDHGKIVLHLAVLRLGDLYDIGKLRLTLAYEDFLELIVGNPRQNAVFDFVADRGGWRKLPISLPAGTMIVDGKRTASR